MAHLGNHVTRGRTRYIGGAPGDTFYGYLRNWYGNINYSYSLHYGPTADLSVKSAETCTDSLHHKSKDNGWKCGGTFALKRVKEWKTYYSGRIARPKSLYNWEEYVGFQVPQFRGVSGSPTYTLPADSSWNVGDYGAQAWNLFKPGKPELSLSVSIAELRDLPRMLKSTLYAFRKEHRNIGSQYLNVQFGWVPFISDIQKLIVTTGKLDTLLTNLYKGNGKWHLRKGTVVNKEELVAMTEWTGTNGFAFSPALPTQLYQVPTAKTVSSSSTARRVWFSGRFRYYLPEDRMKTPEFRNNLIRKIYGLSISPAVLWEAMPWSWLIDYFSNAGDIFDNLSSGVAGDVVAKYAYVMGYNITSHTQRSTVMSVDNQLIAGDIHREQIYKDRDAATPFGFNLSADLSARQLAILAALGISRL